MISKIGDLVFMQLVNAGQVSCGELVTFPTHITTETVALPEWLGDPKDLFMRTACGDSLAADGIWNGDTLICSRKFDATNIMADKIYIVRVFGCDEVAKHIAFTSDGRISLVGRKSGKMDLRVVEPEGVEVLAKIVYSLRYHG